MTVLNPHSGRSGTIWKQQLAVGPPHNSFEIRSRQLITDEPHQFPFGTSTVESIVTGRQDLTRVGLQNSFLNFQILKFANAGASYSWCLCRGRGKERPLGWLVSSITSQSFAYSAECRGWYEWAIKIYWVVKQLLILQRFLTCNMLFVNGKRYMVSPPICKWGNRGSEDQMTYLCSQTLHAMWC